MSRSRVRWIGTAVAAVAAAAAIGVGGASAGRPAVFFTLTPPAASPQGPQAIAWSAPGKTSCSLDGAVFAPCSSPRTYNSLALGPHSLAVALTGNPAVNALYSWSITPVGELDVVMTADGGPVLQTSLQDETFAFLSHQVGATFQCSLDGGAFAACSSPRAYHGIGVGEHSFSVRAVNTLGEASFPTSYGWSVFGIPPRQPTVTCNGSPAALSTALDVVVPAGATCTLTDASINANVRIGAGASLIMNNSLVTGDVVATGARSVRLGVFVGAAGFPNTVMGSIRLNGLAGGTAGIDFDGVHVSGNTVGGNIEVDGGNLPAGIAFIGEDAPNRVSGNIRVDGLAGGLRLTSNFVNGNLRVTGGQGGFGGTSTSFNSVGGNMEFSRNAANGYFIFNSVAFALSCSGNVSVGDQSGTTAGSYLGPQCVPLA